jgi:hypothetical protein
MTETDAYEFDETEIEFAHAVMAMMAQGYTANRCRWLVTCAMLAFQEMEAVQDRRNALHVVDDGRVS